MKIMYRPLDRWVINQRFGENQACTSVTKQGEYIWCDGHNPPNGYISIYGKNGHQGIDLNATQWTPIYCAMTGKVEYIDKNIKSGYDVRIKSRVGDKTFTHIYEHMVKWKPEVGDIIQTGEIIGWVGSTGYSTGPHLHFECRDSSDKPFDPLPLMYEMSASQILKIRNKLKYIAQQVEKIKVGIMGLKKEQEMVK